MRISLEELKAMAQKETRFIQDGEVFYVLPQNELEVEDIPLRGRNVRVFTFQVKYDTNDKEIYLKMAIVGTPAGDKIIQAIEQANKSKKPVQVKVNLKDKAATLYEALKEEGE